MTRTRSDPAARHFAEVAQRFCQAVETQARTDRNSFLRDLQIPLSDAYAAALRLPEYVVSRREPSGEDLYSPVRDSLRDLLGDLDPYWEFFNPRLENEVVQGSLSDTIADVYVDLRRGLDLWRSGAHGAAVSQWRFGFEIHWGHHAVDAIRLLHAWRFQDHEGDASNP